MEAMNPQDQEDSERPDNLTYTPSRAIRAITRAPVMFSVVWIASSISVIQRIVPCEAGFRFQPNQLCVSAEKYATTPVSTEATVTSSAIPYNQPTNQPNFGPTENLLHW